MPVVTPSDIRALVHCKDALCDGYEQQEVDAHRIKTDYLFTDFGGDIPGVERSINHVTFVNEDDAPCPFCGKLREFAEEPRREYQAISGHDPLGLVRGLKGMFNPNHVNGPSDARVAELEATVRRLEQLVTGQQPAKRGPGRPPKPAGD